MGNHEVRKYERLVVDRPKILTDYKFHGTSEQPFQAFMSSDLVPEATVFVDIGTRTRLPRPNPTCEIHAHRSPQLLLFVGAPGSFEAEVPLNDEMYVLNKTTAIWVPAGVKHNLRYRRIDGMMWECGILMQPNYG